MELQLLELLSQHHDQELGPRIVKHIQHSRIPELPRIQAHHVTHSRDTTRSIGRSISANDLRLLRARYIDTAGRSIVQISDTFLTSEASASASVRSTESEDDHTACVGSDQSMTGYLPYRTHGVARRMLNLPLFEELIDILRSLYLDRDSVQTESSGDDIHASADSQVFRNGPYAYDVTESIPASIYGIEEYIAVQLLLNLIISCVVIASTQPLCLRQGTRLPGRPSWDDTDPDWAGAPVKEDRLAKVWRNSRLSESPSMVRAMVWKEIPVTFKRFDCSNAEKTALIRICRDAASKWKCRIVNIEIRSMIHDTTNMGLKKDRHGSHITADLECQCETHRSLTTVHVYVDKELPPTGIWRIAPWCHGLKEPVPSLCQRDAHYPYHLVQHRFTRTHADLDVEEGPERMIEQREMMRQTLADEEFMREREERQRQRDIQAEESLRGLWNEFLV